MSAFMNKAAGLREPVGVLDGLAAVFQGIGFILGTPSMWGYALVPVLMVGLLLGGLGALAVWGAPQVTSALLGEGLAWWGVALSWLLKIVLWAVFLLLAVILALALAQPFSCFALDAIVRAQHRALTHRELPEISLASILWTNLKYTMVTLTLVVLLLGPLFLVGLLFPAALVVTVPAKFLVSSWLLAWDFLDYPLGVHGLAMGARVAWVFRRFGAFSAFGLAWTSVLVVPGVVLLILPMGVAGATRLVVRADRENFVEAAEMA
jgi:CysZ protein